LGETVRYGLVGTGMMGVEHIQNLAITPGAVLTALADPTESSLNRAKSALDDRAEGVQAFANSAELAASGLCDAVIVASPNFTHRAVLEPLFDAGLNILCEKPLATTIDDARWITERAAQSYRCMAGGLVPCACYRSASIASPFCPRWAIGTALPRIPAAQWSKNAAISLI
jgi:myo-inositol 2-dehydrogenase / D-chiro-inositol 1-dehydrogenase